MRELRTEDPYAKHWLFILEAAPLLFQAGLDAREKSFQRAVVTLQIAVEKIASEAVRPGQGLLCHRGTLDALAYWLRNGWDESEFFGYVGMTRDEHYRRYFGVIHLQTAAVGAETNYRRWPDAHRPESAAQAAEIDSFCGQVWRGHPRYVLIDNHLRDWANKARAARDVLGDWRLTVK